MIQKGYDCDIFYCDGQGKGFRKYITYIPRIWFKIIKGKYDVIHCHHALSGIILCLTGLPIFKKCILSYQNNPENEWGYGVFRIFYMFFNHFIIKQRNPYLESKDKVTYLPNGVNSDFFVPMDKKICRERLMLKSDAIYVIYMDSNKGIRTQKRKDRFDDILTLVRSKYGHSNVEAIVMRNVSRELIPIYMNACDLHLLSSDFEGSPNSVKECMCCNTPVVSTNVGNVKEMIGDIKGCYISDSFNVEELAEYVNMVISSSEEFNGRELFLAKGYDMNHVAERLSLIYKNI